MLVQNTKRTDMDNRDSLIKSILPQIPTSVEDATSVEERFQNSVLRPILKLQHDLLCTVFLTSDLVKRSNFNQKDGTQKKNLIVQHLKTNHKLKSHILHVVSSFMSIEEYMHYHENYSSYNKRIISMATHRLIDGLIED